TLDKNVMRRSLEAMVPHFKEWKHRLEAMGPETEIQKQPGGPELLGLFHEQRMEHYRDFTEPELRAQQDQSNRRCRELVPLLDEKKSEVPKFTRELKDLMQHELDYWRESQRSRTKK